MLWQKSYPVSPKCNLVITKPRFFDVRYTQAYLKLHDIGANGAVLDIPISPPLARTFQIFQIHMVCESSRAEYSLHTKPYDSCNMTDWIFKGIANEKDEWLQEVWIAKPDNICNSPYLFFSFKELAGEDPGRISFEFRVTG